MESYCLSYCTYWVFRKYCPNTLLEQASIVCSVVSIELKENQKKLYECTLHCVHTNPAVVRLYDKRYHIQSSENLKNRAIIFSEHPVHISSN